MRLADVTFVRRDTVVVGLLLLVGLTVAALILRALGRLTGSSSGSRGAAARMRRHEVA
jgi:hypothetical protein